MPLHHQIHQLPARAGRLLHLPRSGADLQAHPDAPHRPPDLERHRELRLQAREGDGRPFQLSTDGLDSYPYAVAQHLGHRADYAQLIKQYGQDAEGQRRYSPPRIIGTEKRYIQRHPDPDRVCTSHVERLNLDVRMGCRRFTRLTNAFSRELTNHRAAVAVFAAVHNLVKMHRTIRMTPAMKAGLTNRIWTVGDLLAA